VLKGRFRRSPIGFDAEDDPPMTPFGFGAPGPL